MTHPNHTMRERYEAAIDAPVDTLDHIAATAANNAFEELSGCARARSQKVPNDDRAENLVTAMFAFLIEANEIVEGDQQ